ncbi:MAG: integrase core domain-containing protein [Polyangiaceae bacterium]
MPWLETAPMEERERFIAADRRGLYTRAELCARYGISRKTGYKWLDRYDAGGRPGLRDRSDAPHSCPHRIQAEVADLLCGARRKHPDWGPGKLLDWLAPRHPEVDVWPAVSTAGDLLAREGLVKKRRRRRPHQHPGVVPPTTVAPNDLWTTDFKGQFPTRDGVWCFPLTISDQHTRYLLACQGRPNIKGHGARPVFERTFREFGLPRAIRTDNGVPFATNGIHGLSQLNVWWMRLGIQHQRIHPASPQENGAHERMHRTLKAGACRPPRATMAAQQRAFNRFRALYNDERPHEFLEGATPSSQYTPSPRPFPDTLPPLEYPGHFLVKRVTNAGTFRLKHKLLFIANALQQHHIGLDETEDGIWSIYFGTVLLAKVDEREMIIRD